MSAQQKVDEIAKRHGGANAAAGTLHDLLEQQKREIARALPKHMDADRAIRLAWSAIRGNKDLLSCSQVSVLTAVMEAAQLGLEIDGVLGHAYLIPRRNKWTKRLEANFQIGYRGLIVLAHRADVVTAVNAGVVHEGDDFDFCEGTESFLRHRRALRGRGERFAAWCCVTMKGGSFVWRVLGEDDIERARASAIGSDKTSSPWHTHTDEMWSKTAIRATLKRLPLSPEILTPLQRDERREAGVDDAPALELAPDTSGTETIGDSLGVGDEEPAPIENEVG